SSHARLLPALWRLTPRPLRARLFPYTTLFRSVFSTYKPESDISRLRRGELAVGDADPTVAEVLALCEEVESETAGYFTAWWDGRSEEHTSELQSLTNLVCSLLPEKKHNAPPLA